MACGVTHVGFRFPRIVHSLMREHVQLSKGPFLVQSSVRYTPSSIEGETLLFGASRRNERPINDQRVTLRNFGHISGK